MTPDLALKSILLKTINLPEEFADCFQLYTIPKEDAEFVKTHITSNGTDYESHLDTLLRLFIAFYAESFPEQITVNLKSSPYTTKNDRTREYLLAVAGLLHEAKVILNHYDELFIPYVLAYDEFTKLTVEGSEKANQETLLKKFVNNVETAIQAVIKV